MIRRIIQARWAYFFLLPAYFFFVIFTLLPLVQGVGFSLYDVKLNTRKFVGLQHYVALYHDDAFWKALVNTLLITLGVVPAVVVISILVAVVVHPLNKHVQTFFRMSFYMPVVASGVVLSMVWLWIYNPTYGLFNYLIGLIGLEPVAWLGTPGKALVSIIIVVITLVLGQPIILFLAALGGIPQDLQEAAMIDGANSRQRFFRITLPLLKPTTLFVMVTQTIAVFQVFVVIMLLTNGGPANGTQTIVYRIYQTAFDFFNFGYASALGVVMLVIVSFLAWFNFRLLGQDTEF
ncbi:sn-glycerol-3-phosphate transport system permease protein ugpA [Chlamydia abortus]|uniref:Carbohydrate ABC transporter permease n=1 Tax=Paenibacillus residui TaxID=629724 RepID=A0ABW3DG94_9BACL|nr:sugar ABC transporter permease [Aneurinibacillus sp. XH2]SHE11741.1 sn-glycerol-3-phosphate transport system permease protein ugpA [Chlamydia abortus]